MGIIDIIPWPAKMFVDWRYILSLSRKYSLYRLDLAFRACTLSLLGTSTGTYINVCAGSLNERWGCEEYEKHQEISS